MYECMYVCEECVTVERRGTSFLTSVLSSLWCTSIQSSCRESFLGVCMCLYIREWIPFVAFYSRSGSFLLYFLLSTEFSCHTSQSYPSCLLTKKISSPCRCRYISLFSYRYLAICSLLSFSLLLSLILIAVDKHMLQSLEKEERGRE